MAKPTDDNQKDAIEEAVQQFIEARFRSREPDIDEFVKQYPELEHQIRQKICNLRKIDTLFDSLVQADESDFESTVTGHDLVGKKLGSFEIVEIIGRGGMGVVYLAHDTKLDRSVAIKSMPAELQASSTARLRFRREAKLLASLNHPNIAIIHDIIEQDEGAGYLILEYVPGETLAERIARKSLKIEQALSIGWQVAEAVSAAHKKGIIHRDLKPGNIKITPDDRVKVLDFGLAKSAGDEAPRQDTAVTQPGSVFGTPAYMSPEQLHGDPIDRRTDIWSLGCVMYEMLTGERPFEGKTVSDTVARIIERQPDWQALPQDTPANIRVLLRRCLEKNPHQRLQHIGDAALEIKEALNKPATKPTSKLQRIAMIIIAAIVIVLVAIAVRFTPKQQTPSASKEIRLVVLPLRNHGPAEQEWFADSMTSEITTRLACIHSLGVISYQSAIQYKNRDIGARQIGKELNVDYILEGAIQRKRPSDPNSPVRIQMQLIRADDDTHVWAQPYDEDMDDIFELQSKTAERVAQALDITLLKPEQQALAFRPTENKKAYEYYLSGKEYYDRRDYRRALEMLEKAVDLDPKLALAYAQMSRVYCYMYWVDIDRTQACLDKAWETVEKARNLDPDLPETRLALGHYYYHGLREYDRALKEFAFVLRTQPNNDEALAFTCYVQRKQGKIKEALANIIKASEINPVNRQWAMDIPEILIVLERYSEAVDYCNRTISLYPDRAHPYRVKAWVYLYWEGNTDKARAVLQEASKNIESSETEYADILSILDTFEGNYQKALDLISSTPTRRGPFLPKVFRQAQICELMGKKELARKYYDEARRNYESRLQEGSEGAGLHGYLGIAYAGLGLKDKAISEAKIAEKLHPVTMDAFYHPLVKILAHVYMMVGVHEKAIDQIEYLLTNPDHWSVPLVKIDPTWAPLREHPRYKKLVGADK